jgi:heptosyltransferase II
VAMALEVQRATGCHWLLLGGGADATLSESIAAALRAKGGSAQNLSGQTSLRELCALLRACDLLVTNDTGPMHVAAALGTPMVVPFGSTSPELTGPGLPGGQQHELLRSEAPCSPCFRRECPIDFRCMTGITPETVASAVIRVHARSSAAKPQSV